MLRDDIMAVKKEVEEIKEQSFAMELLKDQKKQNKRLFIIWIITFAAFIGLLGYTLYLLNDIGVVQEESTITQENNDGYNMVISTMARQTIKQTRTIKYRKSNTKNGRCKTCGRFMKKK